MREQNSFAERMWFQFTHPGRGATYLRRTQPHVDLVSIHAPREGCDGFRHCRGQGFTEFQFTHPGRGATRRDTRSSD